MTASPVVDDMDVEDPAWQAIVDRAAGSSTFHDPRLVRAAAARSECRLVALGAWRGSSLVGGIACVGVDSGAVMARSLAAYNGPLVAPLPGANPTTRHRHESEIGAAILEELLRRQRQVSLRMRPGTIDIRSLLDRGWTASMSFTYHLAIDDLAVTWQRISTNRRRLVRRAQQRGMDVREVCEPTPPVIDRIAELHAEQQAGYGIGVDLDHQGWRRALPMLLGSGAGRLFVAVDRDDCIVAFVLTSASSPDGAVLASGAAGAALDDGVAALVRWEMIRRLSADGVRTLDLNGARSGPHGRFKTSFGGELVERWELRSPDPVPTWRSIPRRAAVQARNDLRAIKDAKR